MTTHRAFSIGLIAFGLAACSGSGSNTSSASDSTAAAPATTASSHHDIASGTAVEVTLHDAITSRTNHTGDAVNASVTHDVMDDRGQVAIAAGSPVSVVIGGITASPAGHPQGDGAIELTVTSITAGGEPRPMNVEIRDVPHTMKGRGVTKGEATDIGVGAAVGAIAGQLIGKNTRGTVVGGAVGAVGGGAVAVAGAQKDIVVAPGTHISFALPQTIALRK
jgi:hypothetical protein